MRIAVVDTETTGEDPAAGAELVEVAVVLLGLGEERARDQWHSLVQPERAIPPETSAVHHITDDVIRAGPTVERSYVRDYLLGLGRLDAVVAHNARFDRQFLPELSGATWACTCVVAKHLWPEAPRYGLQVLRYWRGLRPAGLSGMHPHRALYDTICCAELLLDQIAAAIPLTAPRTIRSALDYLLHLSGQVPIQRVCRFGRHRGTPWAEVPRDYLEWVLRQHDFDEEVVATARHYCAKGTQP